MAELSEGWNGPFDVEIVASGPKGASNDKPQWKGQHPPFKDVPQWDVRCKTPFGDKVAMYHLQSKPADGEVLKGAFIEYKPSANVKITLYSAEQREAKKKSGGGFGGGAKPNYSLEQEATRDAQAQAIQAIAGGLEGQNGPVKMTAENIAKVMTLFRKNILEAK
jgi:hypothetical protein